jgi:ComF family protein
LLPKITSPICPRCGVPKDPGAVCTDCSNLKAIDGIRSPFEFEGVIRGAIYQLKYDYIRALAVPLGRLLCDFFLSNPIEGEVLVPVPVHKRRLKERGYNQSALLAGELSRLLNLPLMTDSLVRVRHTRPQVRTAGGAERFDNVDGAFKCLGNGLEHRKIVLVDDVSTSGATLDACAQAIKAAGAASVWGLTLAREI